VGWCGERSEKNMRAEQSRGEERIDEKVEERRKRPVW
jgi:hypothetical protein